MRTRKFFGSLAAVAMLGVGASATAATVYCPSSVGDPLSPPLSGRYVEVTNAANPGACYYQDGNLDSGNPSDYENAGYTLLDKNGSPGTFLISPFPGGVTSGTWQLAANVWTLYSDLHLGFHFGGGSGSPDSFIVQLENGQFSGDWRFLAVSPQTTNNLSNIYLFTRGGPSSSSSSSSSGTSGDIPSSSSGNQVPEPASSLVLLGLGLLGLGFMRRARHSA